MYHVYMQDCLPNQYIIFHLVVRLNNNYVQGHGQGHGQGQENGKQKKALGKNKVIHKEMLKQ